MEEKIRVSNSILDKMNKRYQGFENCYVDKSDGIEFVESLIRFFNFNSVDELFNLNAKVMNYREFIQFMMDNGLREWAIEDAAEIGVTIDSTEETIFEWIDEHYYYYLEHFYNDIKDSSFDWFVSEETEQNLEIEDSYFFVVFYDKLNESKKKFSLKKSIKKNISKRIVEERKRATKKVIKEANFYTYKSGDIASDVLGEIFNTNYDKSFPDEFTKIDLTDEEIEEKTDEILKDYFKRYADVEEMVKEYMETEYSDGIYDLVRELQPATFEKAKSAIISDVKEMIKVHNDDADSFRNEVEVEGMKESKKRIGRKLNEKKRLMKESIDPYKEQIIEITPEMKQKYPSLKDYNEIIFNGKKINWYDAMEFAEKNNAVLPSRKELKDIWNIVDSPDNYRKYYEFAWARENGRNVFGKEIDELAHRICPRYGDRICEKEGYINYAFCLR